MTIQQIKKALEAEFLTEEKIQNGAVDFVYASDLMSDVLAFGKPNSVLVTGLVTQQAVISAHMAEFNVVVFVRGKKPKDDAIEIAKQHGITVLSTQLDTYESCVRLHKIQSGKPLDKSKKAVSAKEQDSLLVEEHYTIEGNDFSNAGVVSTTIKSELKKIGIAPHLVRRVAISTYEAEMNVIMHAERGEVTLTMTPKLIQIVVSDQGKGIENIDLALQEGYTTATDEMRAMGFGSGMGLPNIKRNTDELKIESEVGKGTCLTMIFNITE